MHPTTLPKGMAKWTMMPWPRLPIPLSIDKFPTHNVSLCFDFKDLDLSNQRGISLLCGARRQIRYQDEDEERDGGYGHNEEISKLEFYSQSARGEALIVHALVDQNEVEVLIFKGFSSSLSYGTSPDPTRSILPARAVIKSIDRIKGPFDPAKAL